MVKNVVDLFSGIQSWGIGARKASTLFDLSLEAILPNIHVELLNHPDWLIDSLYTPTDITTHDYTQYDNVHTLYMSFPCNGTSFVGRKEGLNNVHSALFFKGCEWIEYHNPKFVIIEQPYSIVHTGLKSIIEELSSYGYISSAIMLTARMFGLPHKRERVFIIANSHDLRGLLYNASGWSNLVRDAVETVRADALATQAQSTFRSFYDGTRVAVVGVSEFNPVDRREEINALARSICIPNTTVITTLVAKLDADL